MKIRFLKAGNGDSFLLSIKEGEQNRNILIDSGIVSTYYDSATNSDGELKIELDAIKERNEVIDLLVLSHIDDDHICGLTEWFSRDDEAYKMIRHVWFNSGKTIAEYLKEPENKDLQIRLKAFTDPKTGVAEAIELENYLLKNKIWDRKIVLQGQTIENYDVKIQMLSPNESQLVKLLKEYKKITGDDTYTAPKEKDWGRNIIEFIEEESAGHFKFQQDTSPKNGSSISFVLTVKERRFLFLADSHPKDIVKYLKKLGYSKDNPLLVDLFKLSHHGSKGNTDRELIELIRTGNYYISTDGSGHNHPNKRTLARILNSNPNAIFHFNYEHVRDDVFSKKDRADYTIKTRVSPELNFDL